MKNLSLFALAIAFMPTTGMANWDVQKSQEDVFGNVNVTVSALGDNGSLLRFECGSSTKPLFAYLIRDSSGDIPDLEAVFYHVDQDKNRSSSEAALVSWNENYLAVQVREYEMLRAVAEHMVVASASIPVGVEVPILNIRLSDTFSPRGSTAAGKVILEYCVAPEPEADASKIPPTGAASGSTPAPADEQ